MKMQRRSRNWIYPHSTRKVHNGIKRIWFYHSGICTCMCGFRYRRWLTLRQRARSLGIEQAAHIMTQDDFVASFAGETKESMATSMLADFAARRGPMPGVESKQQHCVMYRHLGIGTPGCWEATQCNAPHTVLPNKINFSIIEAPAEWQFPQRVDKTFKPGFKLCVEILHTTMMHLGVHVEAHLLTEEEAAKLLSWVPNGRKASGQGPSAALKGSTSRTAIIEAGKVVSPHQCAGILLPNANWSFENVSQMSTVRMSSPQHTGCNNMSPTFLDSCNSNVSSGNLETQRLRRLMHVSQGLGLPASSSLINRSAGMLPLQTIPATPGTSEGSLTTSSSLYNSGSHSEVSGVLNNHLSPDVGCTTVAHGHMVTREEFTFSDLKFAKPSRMSRIYIAFTCTLQETGDMLVTLFQVPTVCTCRAEQWALACTRLGVTESAAIAPTSIAHFGHGTNSISRAPSSNTLSGEYGSETRIPEIKMEDVNHGSNGPVTVFTAAAHAGSPDHNSGSKLIATRFISPHLAGDQSFTRADSAPVITSTDNSTWASQQQWGVMPRQHSMISTSDCGLIHAKHYNMHLDSHQDMRCQLRGLSDRGLMSQLTTAQDVYSWCEREFNSLGLARRLSVGDLQALVTLSGIEKNGTCNLHQFKNSFMSLLGFMRTIADLWTQQSPCVIAGFAVTRDIAMKQLATQLPGTFLCRLSISGGCGGLAVAIKADPSHHIAAAGKHDTPPAFHVLITAADLAYKSLYNVLRDYAGATHILDVYSGKRVDKRKVFASDYMRLGNLLCGKTRASTQQQPAAAAAPVLLQVPAPSPRHPSAAQLHVIPNGPEVHTTKHISLHVGGHHTTGMQVCSTHTAPDSNGSVTSQSHVYSPSSSYNKLSVAASTYGKDVAMLMPSCASSMLPMQTFPQTGGSLAVPAFMDPTQMDVSLLLDSLPASVHAAMCTGSQDGWVPNLPSIPGSQADVFGNNNMIVLTDDVFAQALLED